MPLRETALLPLPWKDQDVQHSEPAPDATTWRVQAGVDLAVGLNDSGAMPTQVHQQLAAATRGEMGQREIAETG